MSGLIVRVWRRLIGRRSAAFARPREDPREAVERAVVGFGVRFEAAHEAGNKGRLRAAGDRR